MNLNKAKCIFLSCILLTGCNNLKSESVQYTSQPTPIKKINKYDNSIKVSYQSKSETPKLEYYEEDGDVILDYSNYEKKKLIKPSKIYMVYDLTNDLVLTSKNENKIHPIASVTKLMTAYTFLKYYPYELNECYVTVNKNDNNETKSRVKKNKLITCDNMLKIMMTVSDNYAASSLARGIPGISKIQFYNTMNLEAKNLKMNSTYYYDSSGLSPNNRSTAIDLLKLIKEVLRYEKMKEISSVKEIIVNNTTFANSNQLVREGIETDISKTGHISEAGYNLIYVPKNTCNGKKLAFIILGASSSANRFMFARELINKYNCNN